MIHLHRLFLFSLLSASIVHAQALRKTGSLADLSFTEGKWLAKSGERSIEATWLPAKERSMAGFFRMTNGGLPTAYELVVYEQHDDELILLVKNLESGLTERAQTGRPVRHRWVEGGHGWVAFEKEGEAVRLLYERRSDNHFIISQGKQENGAWIYQNLFEFTRAK